MHLARLMTGQSVVLAPCSEQSVERGPRSLWARDLRLFTGLL
jgi:hypothetical protein